MRGSLHTLRKRNPPRAKPTFFFFFPKLNFCLLHNLRVPQFLLLFCAIVLPMADADFASIVRAHTETATIAWKTHHDAGRPNNTLKAWTNLTASLGPSITNDGAVEAAMSIISVKLKEAAESFDGGPRAIADIISYLRPTLDRIRKRLNEHVHGPADVSLPVMVPSVVNPDDRMTRRSGRREASATEVKESPPATHLTPTQQQLYDKLLGAEAARADFCAARLSRARRGLVSPDDATTAFSLPTQ